MPASSADPIHFRAIGPYATRPAWRVTCAIRTCQPGAVQIRSDRTFVFGAPRPAVWHSLGSVDAYTTWWPWLRRLEAPAFAAGATWRCTIQPPVPYVIRCSIRLDELNPSRMVAATVTGDINGEARVELEDDPAGTRVRLVSRLAPSGRWTALVARLAPHVARWGHDRVIETAADQFAAALPRPTDDALRRGLDSPHV
jgi:hypothetical protein